MGNVRLLRLVFARAALHAFFAQTEIFGVIARIFLDPAKGHFDGTCRNLVKKVTVMRNYHHRALPARQVGLQPLERRQVEVVRRLIQEQQVRLL